MIHLDVYLCLSATRTFSLPGGGEAKVVMKSEMPWEGKTELTFSAPKDWNWTVRVPKPNYASDVKVSCHDVCLYFKQEPMLFRCPSRLIKQLLASSL